jgi:glucose/arabinose dehydrogenase
MLIRRNLLAAVAVFAGFMSSGVASAQTLSTKLFVSGLARPIFITQAPGDDTRLFIIEKQGRIRIFNTETGSLNSDYFLNIDSITTGGTSTSSEQGLLGLAFHPDYQNNGYFYVNYTAVAGGGDTVISRYSRGADADHATTSGALTLLTINQPYSNHNGGMIAFGPNDGYLYIFTGDGGSGGDPGDRAQNISSSLLGKTLRIDVDGGTPYSIPLSNPFASGGGEPEIWAYGLRNPWRSTFDMATGDLYIADVGQNSREEMDFQPAQSSGGENYGWRCMEGASCYTSSSGCTCNASNLADPFYTYGHNSAGGYSITGGYVYRGCEIPEIDGMYFFADYGTANFWSATRNRNGTFNVQSRTSELRFSSDGGGTLSNIASFGQDLQGEIYICCQSLGRIYKIILASGETDCGPGPIPGDFNDDGLVNGADLGFFLSQWGQMGGPADLNGDNVVNGADAGILLSNWTG